MEFDRKLIFLIYDDFDSGLLKTATMHFLAKWFKKRTQALSCKPE